MAKVSKKKLQKGVDTIGIIPISNGDVKECSRFCAIVLGKAPKDKDGDGKTIIKKAQELLAIFNGATQEEAAAEEVTEKKQVRKKGEKVGFVIEKLSNGGVTKQEIMDHFSCSESAASSLIGDAKYQHEIPCIRIGKRYYHTEVAPQETK